QLELLFTVDEETGLTGASMLSKDFVTGKVLINIDSEDEGVITVGCAGGTILKIEMMTESTEILDVDFIKIKTGGMLGGHSGIEIHKPRANAIKIIANILSQISKDNDIQIVSIAGGIAHNAIPSNSEVIISVNKANSMSILEKIKNIGNLLTSEHFDIEKDIYIKAGKIDITSGITNSYNKETTTRLIELIKELHHGVIRMSEEVEGVVETSCNLAKIDMKSDKIVITSSLRSNIDEEIAKLKDEIAKIASVYGAKVIASGQYPSWQPNMQSKLLSKCTETYENTFKKSPIIEVIHAGLECGIIGAKYEGMDMISIGPTIQHPHTPDERLNIPSLEQIWVLLSKLLQSYT
ncbi:MAG: beta-Ala-His dipeptidase, partial [Candidatus Heimdallarchaeota archaeon]|nr:beta-Ala-His dipeptidase [Candidatus Heimdallarchaeota archaeon]